MVSFKKLASPLLKTLFSVIAISLLLLHQFHPAITIDAESLGLIVLAALPWLFRFVKGLEVAGVKIDLQDLKAATDKVDVRVQAKTAKLALGTHRAEVKGVPSDDGISSLRTIADTHPNLALVQFRIQIELRIRALAKGHDLLNERVPLSRMIRALVAAEVLDSRTGSGLQEIVALGNQAAHNADVSLDAAQWVLDVGPDILRQLDALLEE